MPIDDLLNQTHAGEAAPAPLRYGALIQMAPNNARRPSFDGVTISLQQLFEVANDIGVGQEFGPVRSRRRGVDFIHSVGRLDLAGLPQSRVKQDCGSGKMTVV